MPSPAEPIRRHTTPTESTVSFESRVAAALLLLLAGLTFVAPTIGGLLLIAAESGVSPYVLQWMVPIFSIVEGNPLGFVQEYWTAIPAVLSGALIAQRRSRRLAARSIFAIMAFVAIGGSMALQFHPDEAVTRAIAAAITEPRQLFRTHAALEEISTQISQTRAIAVPYLSALSGAAGVAAASQAAS